MYGNEMKFGLCPQWGKTICLQGTTQSEESAHAFYPTPPYNSGINILFTEI